jgi:hypothetical protein
MLFGDVTVARPGAGQLVRLASPARDPVSFSSMSAMLDGANYAVERRLAPLRTL